MENHIIEFGPNDMVDISFTEYDPLPPFERYAVNYAEYNERNAPRVRPSQQRLDEIRANQPPRPTRERGPRPFRGE